MQLGQERQQLPQLKLLQIHYATVLYSLHCWCLVLARPRLVSIILLKFRVMLWSNTLDSCLLCSIITIMLHKFKIPFLSDVYEHYIFLILLQHRISNTQKLLQNTIIIIIFYNVNNIILVHHLKMELQLFMNSASIFMQFICMTVEYNNNDMIVPSLMH